MSISWNAILVLLAALVAMDAVFIMTKTVAPQNETSGRIPTREEAHVHLGSSRRKSLPTSPDEEAIFQEEQESDNHKKSGWSVELEKEADSADAEPEDTEAEDAELEDTDPKKAAPEEVKAEEVKAEEVKAEEEKPEEEKPEEEKPEETASGHKVAGLNCEPYGGPADADEMIYWDDIPSDADYVSPLKSHSQNQYLTFEPDQGGWNNIRMSMETAVTLAHAMGRTLVMPPVQGMYLLHDQSNGQKRRFTFTDFFHFDSVATEHAGVEVISMQTFLEREVMTGNCLDKETKVPTFPPFNRTEWDDLPYDETQKLNQWFRTFATNPIWTTNKCVVGLPAAPGPEGPATLRNITAQVSHRDYQDRGKQYSGNPVAVNAAPIDRLDEVLVNRKSICVYDEEHQNAKVIHMMGDEASGARLLVHFYAYLFFEDWRADLWTKRFVRDHLRYVDEIQCAAGRVVKEMRKKAQGHGNENGDFDTLHIRRGDFQYKDTRIDADAIYENIKDVIPDNSTIYIATDERNKTFFNVFHEHYDVYFLDDFKYVLDGVNTNFYGMMDQRIASRGRTFIGCFYSTFTGYINRMRGYHSQKEKAEGWEQGIINSYYYVPLDTKYVVREYRPVAPGIWAREFPTAWRHLERGISELQK